MPETPMPATVPVQMRTKSRRLSFIGYPFLKWRREGDAQEKGSPSGDAPSRPQTDDRKPDEMNSAVCTVAPPARRPTPANPKQTTFPIRRFARADQRHKRCAVCRPDDTAPPTRMDARAFLRRGEPRPRNAPFQAIVRKHRSNDYLSRMREKRTAKALPVPAAHRRGEPPQTPPPKNTFPKTPSPSMISPLSPQKKTAISTR